jgi:hypothetical protein
VAKIVDNNEWEKVVQGVYTGFSIGGSYVKRWTDGASTRYTAKPAEVSIVDNPCMYGATFTMVKADGAFEYRGFAGASNQSSELDRLRVQVRAQMEELMTKVNALIESRATAARQSRFNPQGVEKSDVAAQELQKALANPVRFQPESSTGARFQTVHSIASGVRTAPGGRFVPDGFEKNDVAEQELKKSLNNPIRG